MSRAHVEIVSINEETSSLFERRGPICWKKRREDAAKVEEEDEEENEEISRAHLTYIDWETSRLYRAAYTDLDMIAMIGMCYNPTLSETEMN